jgi:hypothetical protein
MARRFKIKKIFLRGFLYISIASLTALMSDLSGFKQFNEISPVIYAQIIINFFLQGFIAWRAFIDQTISDVKRDEEPKVDLPKISDK